MISGGSGSNLDRRQCGLRPSAPPSPPHIIVHLGYPPRRPPLCYPRLLSLPLIIILSLTWVAWVASFLADFGVVSGRKRQIMLPTALFWTVGSAPLQVWTSPFCRKTRHLCSTRRFLEKILQVGSFFAFCLLFQGPSEGSSGRTRDLQTRLWFDRKSSFSDPRNEKIRKLEMKTNNNPINSNDAGLQPLPGARKRSTRSRCKHRAVCNATGRHRFGVLTAARPVHGSC